ncbi:MAG: hypothetical protein IJ680_08195 [Paludibacteraceae bacterium]|nr:hypothetical protein [Paludibacteraceae bacterium]
MNKKGNEILQREHVTYLLGAGASVGTWKHDKQNTGVPMYSQMESAVNRLLSEVKMGPTLQEELRWLMDKCKRYGTIDVYAKKIYDGEIINVDYGMELDKIKRLLTLCFVLWQNEKNFDTRYTQFIQQITNSNGTFVDNVRILSWNYDVQLELAYRDAFPDLFVDFDYTYRNIFNAICKTFFACRFKPLLPFTYTKLNGVALPLLVNLREPATSLKDVISNHTSEQKISYFNSYGYDEKKRHQISSAISFAWEQRCFDNDQFRLEIERSINSTTILVIIGYSFPDVNHNMDSFIINSMQYLQRIVIQDKSPSQVKQKVELLTQGKVPIDTVEDLSRFYVPHTSSNSFKYCRDGNAYPIKTSYTGI